MFADGADWWQNLLVSARMELCRRARLSLALAIGANAAIFSLVNALTLKPLPVGVVESSSFGFGSAQVPFALGASERVAGDDRVMLNRISDG